MRSTYLLVSDYKGRPRWQMMVKTMVMMSIVVIMMRIDEVNISLSE